MAQNFLSAKLLHNSDGLTFRGGIQPTGVLKFMTFDRFLLALTATGLIPIALGYGFAPSAVLPYLYGFDVSGINHPHLFRAFMGLYLALACFWFLGFAKQELRRPALYSMVAFMFGLPPGGC